jgi:hypothetical protein
MGNGCWLYPKYWNFLAEILNLGLVCLNVKSIPGKTKNTELRIMTLGLKQTRPQKDSNAPQNRFLSQVRRGPVCGTPADRRGLPLTGSPDLVRAHWGRGGESVQAGSSDGGGRESDCCGTSNAAGPALRRRLLLGRWLARGLDGTCLADARVVIVERPVCFRGRTGGPGRMV